MPTAILDRHVSAAVAEELALVAFAVRGARPDCADVVDGTTVMQQGRRVTDRLNPEVGSIGVEPLSAQVAEYAADHRRSTPANMLIIRASHARGIHRLGRHDKNDGYPRPMA